MDLLSAFKRNKPAAPPEAVDSVRLARTRARQRLIGAAVLVVIGIVVFPLLFETQPRPFPVDLPIEILHKDGVAPLKTATPPLAASDTGPKAASGPAPTTERVITETEADAGREVSPAVATAAPTPSDSAASSSAHPKVTEMNEKPRPQAAAAKQADASSADAARAKALLEGKPAASAQAQSSASSTQKFVVQVGAFADPSAVKSTRAKVERLGLTTYTQIAETAAGARTRVRVGPFATRAEAERAAARIKAADLPTVILTL